ncbi:MAG: nuclear transport factor 2 family protein [Candidatus Hydrogenedentes bacterium]|nr:nuclear transport factor 2 family protein [Candidatus Hydrogenedentota bacterium]
MESGLEARVRRLEDIDAIKRLKARYCSYCDDQYDVEGLNQGFSHTPANIHPFAKAKRANTYAH